MCADDPSNRAELARLVADELAQPVLPQVTRMAEAIAALHPGARAVLFYGSCLREAQLDGLMLDFYLVVHEYRSAYLSRWLAVANRWIPPNVFPFTHDGLSAKYAVLSESDFHRLCSADTRNVSVWARFAQPSRLVWCSDSAARTRTISAVAHAAPTLLAAAGRAADEGMLDWWRRAFALTYSTELRAERRGRAASVVDADPDRYIRFGEAAVRLLPAVTGGGWRRRRFEGKLLSIARLAKAAFTFAGGIDYLAWKINRHAGTQIRITDWQRRHPFLAAIWLLPRLLRQGAVK